jgi:signal transduction histidine kinase
MNFYAASAAVVFLSSLISGLFVLIVNPHNKKNILFFLYTLSLSFWSASYTLWQMADNAESALFWVRMLMIGATLIPITHYHHLLSLFDDQKRSRRIFLYVLYGLGALICLNGFSPLFVKGVEQKLNFPFWPIPGLFTHIYFATIPIPSLFGFRLIWENKGKSSPRVQNQLKWFLFASLVGYGAGGTNLPLWYNIPIPPYPMALTSLMPITTAFLFFRLGLIDIGLFMRRSLLYICTCLTLGLGLALVATGLFGNWKISLAFLGVSFLFSPLFMLARKRIEKILATTSIWRDSAALKVIDIRVEKIRQTTYTYDDLAKNIMTSLLSTFPVELAAVYFYDMTKKELHLRAQNGMKNPMVANLKYNRSNLAIADADPLMLMMKGKHDAVSLEALLEGQRKSSTQNNEAVIGTMQRIEADICAPFLFEGRVKGMVVLGKKINNTLYNQEDLEAIYAFTRMAEEIMRYIMGMETELRNTSLYSHDMANDIRAVTQTLEFLENPLIAKQSPEKIRSLVHQARDVAGRLMETYEHSRDRSNLILRAVRGEYEKSPVEVTHLVRVSCNKFALQAEKQKINLTFDIQDKSVVVIGSENDLIRIVDNLISNALRYVNAGGAITVTAKEHGAFFQIEVQDDGEGIVPENIARMWDVGWQVEKKKGAAGMGLSIVKQIVEMHMGTIEASSGGIGKGTKFTIKLPISTHPTT